MSSSSTFLQGNALLHKRFTATFEVKVPLMFLKLILLILTREGPCNKGKKRFVQNDILFLSPIHTTI
ncbi:hypothetical protein AMTRI_Chr12g237120 [Amborella trichopoda]